MVAISLGQGLGPYLVGWIGGEATVPATGPLFLLGLVGTALCLAVAFMLRPAPRTAAHEERGKTVPLGTLLRLPGMVAVLLASVVTVTAGDLLVIYRNEITTKNFIFRTCEFEQMEMQYFVHPGEDEKWFEHWKEKRLQYYLDLGIRKSKLRFHQHGPDELAHYAKVAYDIQYEFPFGWKELEGIHNRTDFDLKRHAEYSGKDLSYLEEATKERYIPYIIETSAGLTRTVLVALSDAYDEEEVEGEKRVVLHFHPRIAPITVGVFPLVKKDGLAELAGKLEEELRDEFRTFYDEGGAIGRRYRRQDEVGTPFCITVDYQTKEDKTVTVRFRDSMEQIRIPTAEISSTLKKAIADYRRKE